MLSASLTAFTQLRPTRTRVGRLECDADNGRDVAVQLAKRRRGESCGERCVLEHVLAQALDADNVAGGHLAGAIASADRSTTWPASASPPLKRRLACVTAAHLVKFLQVSAHKQVEIADAHARGVLRRRLGVVPWTEHPDLLSRAQDAGEHARKADEHVAGGRRGRRSGRGCIRRRCRGQCLRFPPWPGRRPAFVSTDLRQAPDWVETSRTSPVGAARSPPAAAAACSASFARRRRSRSSSAERRTRRFVGSDSGGMATILATKAIVGTSVGVSVPMSSGVTAHRAIALSTIAISALVDTTCGRRGLHRRQSGLATRPCFLNVRQRPHLVGVARDGAVAALAKQQAAGANGLRSARRRQTAHDHHCVNRKNAQQGRWK